MQQAGFHAIVITHRQDVSSVTPLAPEGFDSFILGPISGLLSNLNWKGGAGGQGAGRRRRSHAFFTFFPCFVVLALLGD